MKHTLKLKPFGTPNFVFAEGCEDSFHISELSKESLMALCEQFKLDILTKAAQPYTRPSKVTVR